MELRRVTQVPHVREVTVQNICVDCYGLKPDRVEKLNSYDDKNFRLTKLSLSGTNKNLDKIFDDGYTLKITNAEDTETPDLIEGQNALLRHLKRKGLPVPELVPSTDGNDLVRIFVRYATNDKEETTGGIHAVRILEYIPGEVLCQIPASGDIFYKVGRVLARVHNALEDFRHPIFDHPPTSYWSLYNFRSLKDILYAIDDDRRRRIITDVIDNFEEKIFTQIDNLQNGQIHGDFNEQNILVTRTDQNGYEVCGFLDVGDSHRTCLIFDVAIAIVYMTMLDADDVPWMDAGGHVLAGYLSERSIPSHEARLIRLCMCARYCQSLVFGRYTYLQNPVPDNEYVLFTQKKGWPQLIDLWSISDSELYDSWRQVLKIYGRNDVF